MYIFFYKMFLVIFIFEFLLESVGIINICMNENDEWMNEILLLY